GRGGVGASPGGPAGRRPRQDRAMKPIRLTIVETHPIQYNVPWFRHIAGQCPAIDLTVVYASRPTPAQQAVGYGGSFEWDVDLLEGYRAHVGRGSRPRESFAPAPLGGPAVAEVGGHGGGARAGV